MSYGSDVPSSLRHLKSPFYKVIATRFYDGPLKGFLAHRDWPQACVFQLVDWDRETDTRVYEIGRVEDLAFEDAVERLFTDRRPTWPVWVLPAAAEQRAKRFVDECMARSRPVATITTRDLFGNIALWTPAEDAPASSGLLLVADRKSDTG